MQKQTHLKKLVGLLAVQFVGNTENKRSKGLAEFTQLLGKQRMNIVLAVVGL